MTEIQDTIHKLCVQIDELTKNRDYYRDAYTDEQKLTRALKLELIEEQRKSTNYRNSVIVRYPGCFRCHGSETSIAAEQANALERMAMDKKRMEEEIRQLKDVIDRQADDNNALRHFVNDLEAKLEKAKMAMEELKAKLEDAEGVVATQKAELKQFYHEQELILKELADCRHRLEQAKITEGEIRSKLAHVGRERDAALRDLKLDCTCKTCAHAKHEGDIAFCGNSGNIRCKYEWRGPVEEKT